jgi:catechol 2,3-dioxygenase-like lactoylglutathione lyase family enzyme
MAQRPPAQAGLRHVALFVPDLDACEHFYCTVLGMKEEWRPDADNLYLSSGNDNLALHRATAPERESPAGSPGLDHIGFVLDQIEHVDLWHSFLQSQQVPIAQPPRTHRDGARSLYCRDPAGNLVQLIYHPPIAGWRG